jgi:hypothetical protein
MKRQLLVFAPFMGKVQQDVSQVSPPYYVGVGSSAISDLATSWRPSLTAFGNRKGLHMRAITHACKGINTRITALLIPSAVIFD